MTHPRAVLGGVTILSALMATSVGAQTNFGGVEFPQGVSSFADRVEASNVNVSGAGQPMAWAARSSSSSSTTGLVANTSAFDASVQVTVVFEDGTTEAQTYAVSATSRFNVPVGIFFPNTVDKRFGVVVESLPAAGGTAQIVVERASYNNALLGGQTVVWAAGANAFGTKLR